jgi:hypothetical protein
MNKLILLAVFSLVFPCATRASDKVTPTKSRIPSGTNYSSNDPIFYFSSPRSFLLHDIGTGDGVITRKGPTTGSRVSKLGDTATHEVGHIHKRTGRTTPLYKNRRR